MNTLAKLQVSAITRVRCEHLLGTQHPQIHTYCTHARTHTRVCMPASTECAGKQTMRHIGAEGIIMSKSFPAV